MRADDKLVLSFQKYYWEVVFPHAKYHMAIYSISNEKARCSRDVNIRFAVFKRGIDAS